MQMFENFISYRRKDSSLEVRNIYDALIKKGYSTFCDVYSLKSGNSAPRLYGIRVLASPFAFKVIEFGCSNLLVGSVVDVLHVGSKLFLILVNHILAGVAYLVHNTYLCCGIGEYSAYSLGKAIKIVRAGDEYILHTTSLYISEHTHPE